MLVIDGKIDLEVTISNHQDFLKKFHDKFDSFDIENFNIEKLEKGDDNRKQNGIEKFKYFYNTLNTKWLNWSSDGKIKLSDLLKLTWLDIEDLFDSTKVEHAYKSNFSSVRETEEKDDPKDAFVKRGRFNMEPLKFKDRTIVNKLRYAFEMEMKTEAVDNIYQRLFVKISGDEDGHLDFKSFKTIFLEHLGIQLSDERLLDLFSAFDTDGSQKIDYSEFKEAVNSLQIRMVDIALEMVGLSHNQLVRLLVFGCFYLFFVLIFLLLGIFSFTEGDLFGCTIQSMLPMAAGALRFKSVNAGDKFKNIRMEWLIDQVFKLIS